MGYGDLLTATAQAKQMHEANGRRVVVVNKSGRPQWNELFEHNPRLARDRAEDTQDLLNGPGARPYIESKTHTHWRWQRWNITPGEIYLTDEERAFALPYAGQVLIEPSTKVRPSNKAWLPDRWQRLVNVCGGMTRFVQVGPRNTAWLTGVTPVVTTFRQACAILAASRAYVGTEGGLHHCAAALNTPAVVLWSEYISPEYTGYDTQTNIRHAGKACGSRYPCHGCQQSMAKITVAEVAEALYVRLES
jgi:hypothetical protein